jgi:hypothetical protein
MSFETSSLGKDPGGAAPDHPGKNRPFRYCAIQIVNAASAAVSNISGTIYYAEKL